MAHSIALSLHTAGDDFPEATYPGYARVATKIDDWIVDGTTISPALDIVFTEARGGKELITHVGVWLFSDEPLYGELTPSIPVSAGVTPILLKMLTIETDV